MVPKTVARPTTSRVRESLFSTLESRWGIEGATVLDLFAGSGAFSFEAISRGALFATMCDISPEALRVLDQNATALKVPRAAYTILKADAMREVTYTRAKETFGHLRRPNKEVDSLKWARPSAYDYVFLDPPYAFTDDQVEKILQRLLETEGLTGSDSVVVIESGKARALESVQRGARFEEVLVKKYGTTVMQFLEVKS